MKSQHSQLRLKDLVFQAKKKGLLSENGRKDMGGEKRERNFEITKQ